MVVPWSTDKPCAAARKGLAVGGQASGGGRPRRSSAPAEGDNTMHATIVVPGNSRTILTYLFGRGLEDERYDVERFLDIAHRLASVHEHAVTDL